MGDVRRVTVKGGPELARKLRQIGVDVDGILGMALKAGATVVQRAAQPKAPGPFIVIGEPQKRGKVMEIEVGPDEKHWYYRFAETGAKPHSITASQARALQFYMGGSPVCRRTVSHPGFPARPFLRPSLDENTNQASTAVGQRIKRALP